MPAQPGGTVRSLPEHPNLRHLRDQSKDLVKSGKASSLGEAQLRIARSYGFSSWPKLKAHVEYTKEIGQLKNAIDTNDITRVKTLMTHNPALHKAPMGYGKDGPLTWVAECRIPWEPPSSIKLAIAEWMIERGSDVHQGGDGPLMRAALSGHRIPMMELLLRHGADVNAVWHNEFPIIFSPCETLDPMALRWLLDHGADPNCEDPKRKYPGTALDYVMGSYVRSTELRACMDTLVAAGAKTRYDSPPVIDVLSGRIHQLEARIQEDPLLVMKHFPDLDFGATGGRMLTLRGATLLHVAAEYQNVQAAELLLRRGANVNALSLVDKSGVGGQTPLFHAVTQSRDEGIPMATLLVTHGANLSIRARVPGHYECPGEVLECTAREYAQRFEDEPSGDKTKTVALLRKLEV